MDLELTGACCSSCSRCYGVGSIFLEYLGAARFARFGLQIVSSALGGLEQEATRVEMDRLVDRL